MSDPRFAALVAAVREIAGEMEQDETPARGHYARALHGAISYATDAAPSPFAARGFLAGDTGTPFSSVPTVPNPYHLEGVTTCTNAADLLPGYLSPARFGSE